MISNAKEKLVGRLRGRRRSDEGMVLVEGARAVAEALAGGVDGGFAVVSARVADAEADPVLAALEAAGVETLVIDPDRLEALSDTESPQGYLLVCPEPEGSSAHIVGSPDGVLILDRVQDPGNLGTLVRAARAFGLGGVVALDGTVDPWNPKAVRAAAGMSFRIPVVKESWAIVEEQLREGDCHLWIAAADGADVRSVDVRPPWALVVGNEGVGPRPEVESAAEGALAVAMAGGVDSLNVAMAASILLFAVTSGRSAPDPEGAS